MHALKRNAQLLEKLLHLRIAAWDLLGTFLRLKEVNEVSLFSRNIATHSFLSRQPKLFDQYLKKKLV